MSEQGGTNLWGFEAVDTAHTDIAVLLRPHLRTLTAIGAVAIDILSAGWRPPVRQAATLDELEALPVGTVVTDPDGHVWVRNRVGEWCEPYPAGIAPHDLLADGPVTIHHTPATVQAATG